MKFKSIFKSSVDELDKQSVKSEEQVHSSAYRGSMFYIYDNDAIVGGSLLYLP